VDALGRDVDARLEPGLADTRRPRFPTAGVTLTIIGLEDLVRRIAAG